MAEPLERAWTPDEFFAWQERQPDRYELVHGRPLKMMAGANNVHDLIVVNVVASLKTQLRGAGCRLFTGDSAVETYPGQIRRPDVGLDCGKFEPNAYKAASPRFVAEVVSPSTRDFDAFAKLEEYKSIASLDYILYVEPNAPSVVLWSRGESGAWSDARLEDLEAAIALPAISASLDMRAIYDGVDFPETPRLFAFDPPG